ncbi:MAG: tRNA (adenosine(37)-N6)-threonylcarbamoyltransferase complex dimerization subunit type 1 TsaB, partial [Halanaerobiales bacterium]
MLVMGIDTSGEMCTAGLCNEKGIRGEINIYLSHRHSEELLSNIDFLLKQSGHSMEELGGLCVAVGPGSFTGLRIGLSTVKTFAQVLRIPVVGISTLDLLAYSSSIDRGWLVPVIDARHRRVYTSLYENRRSDIRSAKKWSDQALKGDELLEKLSDNDPEGIYYLIGNGQ